MNDAAVPVYVCRHGYPIAPQCYCPRCGSGHNELTAALERVRVLEEALRDLVKCNEAWNADVEAIIGRQPKAFDGYLDNARKILEGK